MIVPDANVILRYLLGDHTVLSPRAAEIIAHNQMLLRVEVLCEVVYVLEKIYTVPRKEIAAILAEFINMEQVNAPEHDIIAMALQLYSVENLDVVDGILIALNKLDGATIESFDKKLCRYLQGNQ